ncbi:hypothetical protein ACX0G9_27570 [Flavitalea flava]
MKRSFLAICLVIITAGLQAQVSPTIQLNDSASLFGPGRISTGEFEFNTSFSPDNKTVYFSRATVNFGYIAIFSSTLKGSVWTVPEAVSFTGVYRDTDPFVSADGKRLYFSSDRPVKGKPFVDFDYQYFYVELDGNKIVSQPILLELPLAAGQSPSYPSFAENGNIYFHLRDSSGSGDIYYCAFTNGKYAAPVRLSFNDVKFNDFDPMIAKDERFLLFCSTDRKGYGSEDIYVSFKKGDTWSEPVNMGPKINTAAGDGAPGLSRNGDILYFCSNHETQSRPDYGSGKITTQAIMDVFHSTKNGLPSIYMINISGLAEQGSNY